MTKIYTKNTWQDEVLSGDERYNILDNGGAPIESNVQINLATSVAQAGTEFDAAKMNNIENGIDAIDDRVDGMDADIVAVETELNNSFAKTYTPTLTNLNYGAGSMSAKYSRIGDMVHVEIKIVLGAGFSVGAAYVSTPTSINASARHPLGQAVFRDGSASATYIGAVGIITTSAVQIWRIDSSVMRVYALGSTAPFTWAVGDEIQLSFSYIAA